MPRSQRQPSQRNGKPATPEPQPNGKPEEFQRFEDLARKLAKVPKRELDEKRKTA